LEAAVQTLPVQTAQVTKMLLRQLDFVQNQIKELEQKIRELVQATAEMERTRSLPGIGGILSAVIALEVGEMTRFASAERYASYAGTTPRVQASGDKTRYGRMRTDVNQYLRWAYMEAAHSVCLYRKMYPERHGSRLYERIRSRKGHGKAIGAVARHLAEATFPVWMRKELYQDPVLRKGQSREV
jgi:transposase